MFRLGFHFIDSRFFWGWDTTNNRNVEFVVANNRNIDLVVEFALLDEQQTSGVSMCSDAGPGARLADGTLGSTLLRRMLMRVLDHLGDFN